mmetsp:Transcript_137280/g.325175  ORF Transcript_137280/g.325175 Transcript_137280/m.325175 type:complete len:376 (-) Transcript_137280:636-1763(-)
MSVDTAADQAPANLLNQRARRIAGRLPNVVVFGDGFDSLGGQDFQRLQEAILIQQRASVRAPRPRASLPFRPHDVEHGHIPAVQRSLFLSKNVDEDGACSTAQVLHALVTFHFFWKDVGCTAKGRMQLDARQQRSCLGQILGSHQLPASLAACLQQVQVKRLVVLADFAELQSLLLLQQLTEGAVDGAAPNIETIIPCIAGGRVPGRRLQVERREGLRLGLEDELNAFDLLSASSQALRHLCVHGAGPLLAFFGSPLRLWQQPAGLCILRLQLEELLQILLRVAKISALNVGAGSPEERLEVGGILCQNVITRHLGSIEVAQLQHTLRLVQLTGLLELLGLSFAGLTHGFAVREVFQHPAVSLQGHEVPLFSKEP